MAHGKAASAYKTDCLTPENQTTIQHFHVWFLKDRGENLPDFVGNSIGS